MTYRDDRDALRHRVDELERELAESRRRIEQMETARARSERLELDLATAQRSWDRMRAEIRRRPLDEPARRRRRSAAAMILVGMAAWGMVAGVALLRSARPFRHGPPGHRGEFEG